MNTVVKGFSFAVYRRLVQLTRWTHLGRIYPFESVHHYILNRLKPECIDRNGLRFYLDAKDNCGLSYSKLHDADLGFLLRQVQPGARILDIGANIGLYTVVLARHVGEQGHVYAFEPDPTNFSLLSRNIAANGLQNVTAVQKAVSDRNGTARLYLSKTHSGLHRLHPSGVCGNSITVDCVRLDDFFPNNTCRIDLVKLDVEGHEVSVLRGMLELMRRNPQIQLFTEYCPAWLTEAGDSADEYVGLLEAHGFRCHEVRSGQRLAPSLPELERVNHRTSDKPRNLWCVKPTCPHQPTEV